MSNFSCFGSSKSFPFSTQADTAASLRSREAGQRASAGRIGAARSGITRHASPVVRSRAILKIRRRSIREQAHARDRDIRPRLSDLHAIFSCHRFARIACGSGEDATGEDRGASGVLSRFFRKGGEVAIIAFRGIAAQVLRVPSRIVQEAGTALEYLPMVAMKGAEADIAPKQPIIHRM